MMFPYLDIHKYTWTSPDTKTHKEIDHILIDRRWHWCVLYLRSFRRANCDTDHYLAVAKVRENLAGNNRTEQKFNVERFNLRKLSELEVRKEYQIKSSNRSAALQNFK